MKINITISLEKEIVERLKEEDNYSELINREIKAYYEGVESLNLKRLKQKHAEIKLILKQKRRESREVGRNIEKLEQKESRILKITTKLSPETIKIIRGCSSVVILRELYKTKDPRMKFLKKYGWMELRKFYDFVKGGGQL